ncbi:uncharacterized protein LOC116211806 isoform X2 [Punica granatum]|uniref:Uncharacterized protein LOC116211806 isoform X1 n=1 Tax=Punica granatum TaxID=22663 RepID=A0A6P8DXC9_PUNGR|nr:uncharacterized protein LOC116211806 isoform X1 [Punica granatum]XP_031402179.1 uncharacterized protein LOC116211806 isoform X2 [Punica granatum]
MATRAPAFLPPSRLETQNSHNGGIPPREPIIPRRPELSFSKPSWIVRTESNVRKEARMRLDPPCVVCKGSGRIDCHPCNGRGRTNYIHLAMLPKGAWPKWCRRCGGSGLDYCSRCLGTGEYRYIMGFRFMERDTNSNGK